VTVNSADLNDTAGDAPFLESIPPRRLPDLIAQQVVSGIRTGALKPGDRLPTEQELARQLGVGRTSVREGLQKLQTLGIVEVRKGRGAFVAERTEGDATDVFTHWVAGNAFAIEELLEVRMALEAVAAGLAAIRASDAQIALIERESGSHRAAGETGDLAEIVRSDQRFHEALLEASGNRLLGRLYAGLIPEVSEFRQKTLALPLAPDRSAAAHDAIVEALRTHDPGAARRAMVDHLWVLYTEVHTEAEGQQPEMVAELAPREAIN
jgi:GntR family transcriptional repressor for pyruvate dehydrogenase complex